MRDKEKFVGWAEIALFLRCSEASVRARAKELIEKGVVFTEQKGSPPRRRMCAYRHDLMAWDKTKNSFEFASYQEEEKK